MALSVRQARASAGAVLVGVVVLIILGAIVLRPAHAPSAEARPAPTLPPQSVCLVTSATGRLPLDPEQAENATTIAAVGKQAGLADDAVTVAFVAALQESRLRNLAYGDLDSLGLFQQRPSQGWGMPSQVLLPSYAAGAFYRALVKVPGWQAMSVGDAAQAVQRSAVPDAYARWEQQARLLADALTGETAAAFTCQFVSTAAPAADPGALGGAIAEELGPQALSDPVAAAEGWTVASWLIARASTYHITSVSFLGQRWTASSGEWQPADPGMPLVAITRA
jgi:hypothetical protein